MNFKKIFLIAAAAGFVALTGCAARSEYYGVYITEGTDHRTSSYTSDIGTYEPVETEDSALHIGNSPEITEEAPETAAPTSTPSSTVPINSIPSESAPTDLTTSEPTPTDPTTSESTPTDPVTSESDHEISPQTPELLPESTPASSTPAPQTAPKPQTAPEPQTTTSAPQTPAPSTKPSAPATQSTPATPSAPAAPSTSDTPKTHAPSTNPINPATAPETPASSEKADTTTATVAAVVDEPAPADDYITEVVRLVNAERAKEGLSPLALDNNLSKAARVRAEEQIELFGHTRPDGQSCFSVLKDYKISYRKAGENAAAGYYTPEDVVDAWMSSDGHRANILKPNYDKIGIGFVYSDDSYGVYWVQLFIDE